MAGVQDEQLFSEQGVVELPAGSRDACKYGGRNARAPPQPPGEFALCQIAPLQASDLSLIDVIEPPQASTIARQKRHRWIRVDILHSLPSQMFLER